MEKANILNSYINEIDNVDTSNKTDMGNLIEEISRICIDDEELGGLVLNYYWNNNDDIDYIQDLKKLKAKLKYDSATLLDIDKARDKELEILRLQSKTPQSKTTYNNNNINTNNLSSIVTITLAQTIENINGISDKVLSPFQKEELDDMLSLVDSAINSGDKDKTWSKVGKVLKYITDKGVEVGTATLPYLNEITKLLGNQ